MSWQNRKSLKEESYIGRTKKFFLVRKRAGKKIGRKVKIVVRL